MVKKNASTARKLQAMLKDLGDMKAELLPDNGNPLDPAMQNMDSFSRLHHELNGKLNRIRQEVDRLNELRRAKSRGESDGRDATTIRIQSDNTSALKQVTEMFNELKKLQMKEEGRKAGTKKKLSEKELSDRRELLRLAAENIKLLAEQNSRVKAFDADDTVAAMESRVEQQKAKQREDREGRKARRAKLRANGKVPSNNADAFDASEIPTNSGPQSEQEQAFEMKVAENNAEQDLMLQEIAAGLEELQILATEANKHLQVQAAMLDQVDEKIDKNIRAFKTANARLQDLLDQSGGLSRWCPIIICIIILIAVIGYMTSYF